MTREIVVVRDGQHLSVGRPVCQISVCLLVLDHMDNHHLTSLLDVGWFPLPPFFFLGGAGLCAASKQPYLPSLPSPNSPRVPIKNDRSNIDSAGIERRSYAIESSEITQSYSGYLLSDMQSIHYRSGRKSMTQ